VAGKVSYPSLLGDRHQEGFRLLTAHLDGPKAAVKEGSARKSSRASTSLGGGQDPGCRRGLATVVRLAGWYDDKVVKVGASSPTHPV
jgi:hypothetical protein